MKKLNYAQALNEALREEMARFPELLILGQDICRPAGEDGAFQVTAGLPQLFPERVINAVLNESVIVGSGVGIALRGGKAVVEMQFADFVTDAAKMIRDYVAGLYYRNRISLPLVIRLPAGAIGSAGPFHSLCPESLFFDVPGLIMLAPSTPYDAKGLLKTAIRSPSPIIFIEWKKLYRLPPDKYPKELDFEIPDEDYAVPIGKARLVRAGSDITIISWGNALFESLRACDMLKKEGFEAELIDLRSIMPFDHEMIFESVARTNRVIIAHEAKKIGGIGVTLAQMISEALFDWLDAPPVVVGAKFTPIPHHPNLENAYLPKAEDIVRAAKEKILGIERVRKIVTQPIRTEKAEDESSEAGVTRVPLSQMRRIIAKNMATQGQRPLVHDTIEVDLRRILDYNAQWKDKFVSSFQLRPTLTHYIAYVLARVLMEEEYWPLRSCFEEKKDPETGEVLLKEPLEIKKKGFVNLGIATSLGSEGLLVPVVRNAHLLKFHELAKNITELAEKCRQKKITPDELSGGNFTLTNVGMFGTKSGNPITPDFEHSAILAVGTICERGERKEITLTLGFDHRMIDGELAGKFKSALRDALEKFSVDIFSA